MTKYFVDIVMSACVSVKVEANDEAEAQSLALKKINPCMAMEDDWDYEIDYIEKNDDKEEEE